MFIFFHLFISLILFELPKIVKKVPISRLFLIIGALLPDLIDKPLNLLGIYNGRSFFHAPIFWFVIEAILFVVFNRKDVVKGIGYGTIIHIMMDLPMIPIFWPFVQYDFTFIENYVSDWLWTITHDPIIIITEGISLLGLSYLIIRHQLFFNWKQTKDYLLHDLTPPKELK